MNIPKTAEHDKTTNLSRVSRLSGVNLTRNSLANILTWWAGPGRTGFQKNPVLLHRLRVLFTPLQGKATCML
jgi:hypothetical protein